MSSCSSHQFIAEAKDKLLAIHFWVSKDHPKLPPPSFLLGAGMYYREDFLSVQYFHAIGRIEALSLVAHNDPYDLCAHLLYFLVFFE